MKNILFILLIVLILYNSSFKEGIIGKSKDCPIPKCSKTKCNEITDMNNCNKETHCSYNTKTNKCEFSKVNCNIKPPFNISIKAADKGSNPVFTNLYS